MDFLVVLAKWKRFLVFNVFFIAVIATAISLILPKWYKSAARLLPPKEQGSSLTGISQIAKNFLPLDALGNLGKSQESYNYLAILESRTAMERVIDRFDLMGIYEIGDSSVEKTIKALEDNVNFDIEEEGTIVIEVWDQDARRAADMANYFVSILNEISIQLGTREARNNRAFIEKRYLGVLADLKETEDTLRAFQKKYGIYSLQEALSGKFLSSFVPYDQVPYLTMQYIRLYRDFEIQNKLLEFVLPIYEQAKVDEQKETPVVLVLDEAVPAERKDKPKRALVVLSAALSALILSLMFVFFYEWMRLLESKSPERYHALRSLLRFYRRT